MYFNLVESSLHDFTHRDELEKLKAEFIALLEDNLSLQKNFSDLTICQKVIQGHTVHNLHKRQFLLFT